MKSKLLVAILLTLATATNAFAAKSATAPLNGPYAVSQNGFCTANATTPVPSTVPFSFVSQQAGNFSFVPDTVQSSFSAWVTSVVKKQFVNPSTFINVTQDPTAANGIKLAETPIQWGTIVVESVELQTSFPFTSSPSLNRSAQIQQFFMTSFNYAIPSNNNNIKTGYRIYTSSVGDKAWGAGITEIFFITNPTTKLFTSGAGVDYYQTTMSFNGGNYLFDCTNTYHLSQ